MDLNCRLVFSAVKIFLIIFKIQCGRLYFPGKIYFPLNARFRKKGVAEKSDLAESVGVTDFFVFIGTNTNDLQQSSAYLPDTES